MDATEQKRRRDVAFDVQGDDETDRSKVQKSESRIATIEGEITSSAAAIEVATGFGQNRNADGFADSSSLASAGGNDSTPAAASSSAAPASELTGPSSSASPGSLMPVVLLSIGGGVYSVLENDKVLDTQRMGLLKAAKRDDGFAASLKDVALDQCRVEVIASTQARKPTADEMLAKMDLEGAETIGSLPGALSAPYLFIHVRLPQTMDTVDRASVPPKLSAYALRLVSEAQAARAMLAKCRMLQRTTARVKVADADDLGLTILGAINDDVELGVFTLPSVPNAISLSPKGFNLGKDQVFFHQPQRAELAYQFKTDMDTNKQQHGFVGTLASGCNGTGKSATGIEAYAASAANNHIVVYVPTASAWVTNALANMGNGFFLDMLLKQNADLIVKDRVLVQVFEPLLHDPFPERFHPEPVCGRVMSSLVGALQARPGPAVGVIVDEVQHITTVITEASVSKAHGGAAAYFQQWHNWDNDNKVFVRMDIASSHGQRELKLPSGDDVRLKVVRPWNSREVDAALSNDKSPLYIVDEAFRKRIVYIAGGIPRSLFGAHASRLEGKPIGQVEDLLRASMLECCNRWFDALNEEEKVDSARNMFPLVRGEVLWDRVKGLYDDGLVACSQDDRHVMPISPIAASTIISVLSQKERATRPGLGSVESGDPRGKELERQLLSSLSRADFSLPAKNFDCSCAANVRAKCDGDKIMFHNIAELKEHPILFTLYIPFSKQFAFDAATVPPVDKPDEPIVVWEASVTAPRDPERLQQKPENWMRGSDDIIHQLRLAFPDRSIVCAFAYDVDLTTKDPARPKTAFKTALQLAEGINAVEAKKAEEAGTGATAPTISLVVVDRPGLVHLGVLADAPQPAA